MKRKLIIGSVIVLIMLIVGVTIASGTIMGERKVEQKLELGNKYLQEGEYEQAILAYEALIDIDQNNIEARTAMTKAYIELGEMEKAEVIARDAIDIDETQVEPWVVLAQIYEKTKTKPEIAQLYQEAFDKTGDTQFSSWINIHTPEKPIVNYKSGEYGEPFEVSISNIVGSETVQYRLNGSNEIKYENNILIDQEKTTLNLKSINEYQLESDEVTYEYVITASENNQNVNDDSDNNDNENSQQVKEIQAVLPQLKMSDVAGWYSLECLKDQNFKTIIEIEDIILRGQCDPGCILLPNGLTAHSEGVQPYYNGYWWHLSENKIEIKAEPVYEYEDGYLYTMGFVNYYRNEMMNFEESIFEGVSTLYEYYKKIELSENLSDEWYPYSYPNGDPDDKIRTQPFISNINASSYLDNSSQYNSDRLIDGNLATAWVEGASGQGEGENLTFEFSEAININTIRLINGYAKSEDIYHKNSRAQSMDIIVNLSDGSVQEFKAKLYDNVLGFQYIPLDLNQTVTSVQLTIASVYPGSKYQDTCISEVYFE